MLDLEQLFTKWIERNPNNAEAYFSRGNIRSDLGDKKGALSDYNKARELTPEDSLV